MADTAKINALENDLMKVVNRHIDENEMVTEDVYGALCGIGFRVVQASKPAETVSVEGGVNKILESNLSESDG
jgi:hypothetical protein